MSITAGRNVTTPLRLLPISGVMFAEVHPMAVLPESPYSTRSVAVKDVKA